MMNYFNGSLMIWLSYIPFYILKLAGITYAIMRRKAHPQVSLAAGIYFAGSLIFSILEIGLSSVIPVQFMKNGYGAQEMTVALSFVRLFSDVIQFCFAIVLLFAIFGWRAEKSSIPTIE